MVLSAPNSWSFLWLVKGATQLCTSQKESNKLDLNAAQYFSLVDYNGWYWWFAISSPPCISVLLVGLPKQNSST
jgi:hypothetical protein